MGEGAWLVAFLIAQRLIELCFAQLNTRRLRGMGGIEFGAAHYPLIVILHAAWIVGLLILGHDQAKHFDEQFIEVRLPLFVREIHHRSRVADYGK